jgi:hypothetical protein
MVQPSALSAPARSGDASGPRPVGRRAAARLRLAIPVRLLSTRATESCVLLDLSRTGARVGLARPLAPGELLWLKVGPLEIFAEVVRCLRGRDGGVNGLVFDQPLSDDQVLAVRRHAETFEQRQHDALLDQVRRWVTGEAPA